MSKVAYVVDDRRKEHQLFLEAQEKIAQLVQLEEGLTKAQGDLATLWERFSNGDY